MMSSDKETHAINIRRVKTYKVRKKLTIGGERSENPNGSQQFPNWRAQIITGGTQEVSLQVLVSDQ
jgi:hypothetical protein